MENTIMLLKCYCCCGHRMLLKVFTLSHVDVLSYLMLLFLFYFSIRWLFTLLTDFLVLIWHANVNVSCDDTVLNLDCICVLFKIISPFTPETNFSRNRCGWWSFSRFCFCTLESFGIKQYEKLHYSHCISVRNETLPNCVACDEPFCLGKIPRDLDKLPFWQLKNPHIYILSVLFYINIMITLNWRAKSAGW